MISVIIPARNEEKSLPVLLSFLQRLPDKHLIAEVIVSDGNSSDSTIDVARSFGARVVMNAVPGRGRQMNNAAETATGKILYFLHADSIPPQSFATRISKCSAEGFPCGCFRLRFDYPHWFLRFNSWFTRFDVNAVRFGDQSLFTDAAIFRSSGGYREDYLLLEDQEIIPRLRTKDKFIVIDDYVTTSARKYLDNGIIRLQLIYFAVYFLYRLGYPQKKLVTVYKRLIRKQDMVV